MCIEKKDCKKIEKAPRRRIKEAEKEKRKIDNFEVENVFVCFFPHTTRKGTFFYSEWK